MGKKKDLLIPCDWEREFQMDFIYLLEAREEQKEAINRIPAQITVVDRRPIKKRKHEFEFRDLPF